ncbi:hypothetical protein ACJ73_00839 [Blastomyces percursus]|uniref:Uncharacterized protein n=1 Tax=Blastomyces percursus TaxID=1658174 RepID=A0A1J9QH22_9EURO|nr:hypothetical protein ACJ73_00839 [Blastomyces percursus]
MNGAGGSHQWIKAGIEYVDGKAHISVVGKDQWADWSLMPLPAAREEEANIGAKIEMVREKDVYRWTYLVEGGERRRIRQVNWTFVDEGVKECWVGVYAARPVKAGGELEVAFKELEIELSG